METLESLIDPEAVITALLFALVGFVWNISHKVTQLSTKIDDLRKDVDRQREDIHKLEERVDQVRPPSSFLHVFPKTLADIVRIHDIRNRRVYDTLFRRDRSL